MANRIKAAQMTVFANDRQLDRLQAFGVTARLNSEDLKEIGNLDIVEVSDDVPAVEITIDSNQYGSLKTLLALQKKKFDTSGIDVSLATSGAIKVSSGAYYVNEMKYAYAGTSAQAIAAPTGASQRRIDTVSLTIGGSLVVTAGTATTGVPAAPATPSGSIKLAEVERWSNASSGAVAMTALNILNCNDPYSFALKDFEFAKVDFVCPIKEAGDNTTTDKITRTMYVEGAYANRYDASFATNGVATESWGVESDNKTWFLNTANVIFVDRSTTTGTAQTLSYTPTLRTNGNYTLKAYKYNATTDVYTDLAEGTDYSVSGTTLTLVVGLAAGETLVVRYPTNGANVSDADMPFFRREPGVPVGHPGVAGGLKSGNIEIYLSDDLNNKVLRVESVSISASLSREVLFQLGQKRAYDRSLTFPIPITVQLSTLQSDLKEYIRLTGGDFAATNEVSVTEFLKNMNLVVKIYREDNEVRAVAPYVQRQPIKTVTVNNLAITDEGMDLRVDGNGTQTFSFKANTQYTITGIN